MSTVVFSNQHGTRAGAHSVSFQRVFIPNSNTGTASFLLGASLAMVIGVATSGGVVTVNGVTGSGTLMGQKVIAISGSAKGSPSDKHVGAFDRDGNWASDLDWIRANSDVSMSSLADLFGVTRKALYGWLEGAEPRKPRQDRISALKNLLTTLPSREYRSAFFEIADRGLASGETLRGIFSASAPGDDGLIEHLNNALAELDPILEQAARRLEKGSARSRQFEAEFRAT